MLRLYKNLTCFNNALMLRLVLVRPPEHPFKTFAKYTDAREWIGNGAVQR